VSFNSKRTLLETSVSVFKMFGVLLMPLFLCTSAAYHVTNMPFRPSKSSFCRNCSSKQSYIFKFVSRSKHQL